MHGVGERISAPSDDKQFNKKESKRNSLGSKFIFTHVFQHLPGAALTGPRRGGFLGLDEAGEAGQPMRGRARKGQHLEGRMEAEKS